MSDGVATPNIEALARVLASAEVHDAVYSDHWFGWPNPDNEAQVQEAIEDAMPSARTTALRYARILGVA